MHLQPIQTTLAPALVAAALTGLYRTMLLPPKFIARGPYIYCTYADMAFAYVVYHARNGVYWPETKGGNN